MNAAHKPKPTMGEAFKSLRVPEYRTLWWAGVFSFLSVQMQFVLRGILAWDLTLREGALGLSYAFFGLSMLIATPLGGVVADRIPRRTTLLVSQAMIFGGASFMGIAVLTDIIAFWMVLASSVIQGLAFGFYGPARVAFASDLVGRDQLGNAITLSMFSLSFTRVFGPSLAGALAGWALFGIGGAYLLSAFASCLSLVWLARLPSIAIENPSRRSPLDDIASGVRYVRANPPIRRLVVSSFVIIMFGFNYVAFIPALVKDVFGFAEDAGNRWIGFLSMASAIGAVAVSLPLASRADGPNAKRMMIGFGLAFGAAVAVLATTPNLAAAFAVVILIGGFTTGYQSISNTLALQMADNEYQGRVQSLMQLSFAGFGLAALPLGVVAEAITLRPTIALMGLITVAAAALYLLAESRAGFDASAEASSSADDGSERASGSAADAGQPEPATR